MRKLLMYMQSTANGFGADPGDEMFWAKVSDQTWEFTNSLHDRCDAMVMGRKMYQDFLGFWPEQAKDESDSDVARHARWQYDLAKYVLSASLTEADPSWPNTQILSSLDDLKALKEQPGKDILIAGGIGITKACANAGLIDDYYIHVNPATIPEGTLLLDARLDLQLVDVKQHDTGVVALHYRPA
ncbi:dihydrofolate reductase family protein [Saccharopolyspora sp. NPDC000359]|uniref:dihydrofolate reductase family protein n=1 Tax=Saccharopolyspora sp. NPDC000359 TaxID=3154251 RepID=UPI0033278B39